MSREIAVGYRTGQTLYFYVQRPSDGFWWYTPTPVFEAYNAAHYASYKVPMVEVGATGDYFGDFPTGIGSGTYRWEARLQAGGSPATTDLKLADLEPFLWSGSSVLPALPAGWPTVNDVLQKLQYTSPDGLVVNVTDDVANILNAVIQEFQSPVDEAGVAGGTGRLFTPTLLTRTFTGNGRLVLPVPELVHPSEGGTALTVTVDGVAVTGAVPVQRGGRRPWDGLALGSGASLARWSPTAYGNVSVLGTWGYAASVPTDVWEAVRCETAFRALVQGAIPLTGVGEAVGIGSFNINTSSGISVWKESSPVAIFHQVYEEAVKRYRDPEQAFLRLTAGLPRGLSAGGWR